MKEEEEGEQKSSATEWHQRHLLQLRRVQWRVRLLLVRLVTHRFVGAGQVHVRVVGQQRRHVQLAVCGLGVLAVVVLLQGLVQLVDLTEGELLVGQ